MARLITGLTREQERAFQQRVFARVANVIEPQIRREIARTMLAMARAYEDTGRQTEILEAHRVAIAEILNRAWNRVASVSGKRLLESVKSHRPVETKDESDYFRRMREWVAINGALKVTRIVGTTREQAIDIINDAVAQSVVEGFGQAETGRLIQSVMRERGAMLSTQRARVIARTETHAASGASNQAAAKATGLALRKEWISARDPERTREDHDSADGQTVDLDQPFIVGGEPLMYPGDPNGSAEQVINCRCAVAYVPSE